MHGGAHKMRPSRALPTFRIALYSMAELFAQTPARGVAKANDPAIRRTTTPHRRYDRQHANGADLGAR